MNSFTSGFLLGAALVAVIFAFRHAIIALAEREYAAAKAKVEAKFAPAAVVPPAAAQPPAVSS